MSVILSVEPQKSKPGLDLGIKSPRLEDPQPSPPLQATVGRQRRPQQRSAHCSGTLHQILAPEIVRPQLVVLSWFLVSAIMSSVEVGVVLWDRRSIWNLKRRDAGADVGDPVKLQRLQLWSISRASGVRLFTTGASISFKTVWDSERRLRDPLCQKGTLPLCTFLASAGADAGASLATHSALSRCSAFKQFAICEAMSGLICLLLYISQRRRRRNLIVCRPHSGCCSAQVGTCESCCCAACPILACWRCACKAPRLQATYFMLLWDSTAASNKCKERRREKCYEGAIRGYRV